MPSPSPEPLKIVYVCKAVDADSPTVATQARWIAALAANDRVGHVTVLTGHHGRCELGPNVDVRSFGAVAEVTPAPRPDSLHRLVTKIPGAAWAPVVLRFLTKAAALRRRDVDFFFVAQGGPYPALLLPWKLAFGRPLYQWKAQPHVSSKMAFYARWCDDLIFTATPGSFPASAKPGGVRVVGHGIDTNLFLPGHATMLRRDLVAIGRVSPIKRIDWVLRAMAVRRDRTGQSSTLDVIGPYGAGEAHYAYLVALAEELGLTAHVRFLGSVAHEEIPLRLAGYRAMVNFSDTAFDKAAGEAMACGLPVITTNPCTIEMMPVDQRDALVAEHDSVEDQARVIGEVLAWDDATRASAALSLRQAIVSTHSLDSLFDKILDATADDAHWRP